MLLILALIYILLLDPVGIRLSHLLFRWAVTKKKKLETEKRKKERKGKKKNHERKERQRRAREMAKGEKLWWLKWRREER